MEPLRLVSSRIAKQDENSTQSSKEFLVAWSVSPKLFKDSTDTPTEVNGEEKKKQTDESFTIEIWHSLEECMYCCEEVLKTSSLSDAVGALSTAACDASHPSPSTVQELLKNQITAMTEVIRVESGKGGAQSALILELLCSYTDGGELSAHMRDIGVPELVVTLLSSSPGHSTTRTTASKLMRSLCADGQSRRRLLALLSQMNKSCGKDEDREFLELFSQDYGLSGQKIDTTDFVAVNQDVLVGLVRRYLHLIDEDEHQCVSSKDRLDACSLLVTEIFATFLPGFMVDPIAWVPNTASIFSHSLVKQSESQPVKTKKGFLNREGRAVAKGTGAGVNRWYCGAKYTSAGGCSCGGCDGNCGPNNGCCCPSCAEFAAEYIKEQAGCDEFCSVGHNSDICIVCGNGWGNHAGHTCPNGYRERGSFPDVAAKKEREQEKQAKDDEAKERGSKSHSVPSLSHTQTLYAFESCCDTMEKMMPIDGIIRDHDDSRRDSKWAPSMRKVMEVLVSGSCEIFLAAVNEARAHRSLLLSVPFVALLRRLSEFTTSASSTPSTSNRFDFRFSSNDPGKLAQTPPYGRYAALWTSSGAQGSHWIRMTAKPEYIVKKFAIHVAPEDGSFTPEQIEVWGGCDVGSLKRLKTMTLTRGAKKGLNGGLEHVLIDGEKSFPIVEVRIRRAVSSGVNVKVRAVEGSVIRSVGSSNSFLGDLMRLMSGGMLVQYTAKEKVWWHAAKETHPHGPLLAYFPTIEATIHFEQNFAEMCLKEASLRSCISNVLHRSLITTLKEKLFNEQGKELRAMIAEYLQTMTHPQDYQHRLASLPPEVVARTSITRRLCRMVVAADPENGTLDQMLGICGDALMQPVVLAMASPSIETLNAAINMLAQTVLELFGGGPIVEAGLRSLAQSAFSRLSEDTINRLAAHVVHLLDATISSNHANGTLSLKSCVAQLQLLRQTHFVEYFEHHYTRKLAQRLLFGNSNVVHEKDRVHQLIESCEGRMRNGCTVMVNDVLYSQSMNIRFGDRQLERLDAALSRCNEIDAAHVGVAIGNIALSVSMNAYIITRDVWPPYPLSSPSLPPYLTSFNHDFRETHGKRRLQWCFRQSCAVIEHTDTNTLITVSGEQLGGLLLFNDNDIVDLAAFKQALGCSNADFVVEKMVSAGALTLTHQGSRVSLNSQYFDHKEKSMLIVEENEEISPENVSHIGGLKALLLWRRHLIAASIIRVVKASPMKTAMKTDVIQQVIDVCKPLFLCSKDDVAAAIESLLLRQSLAVDGEKLMFDISQRPPEIDSGLSVPYPVNQQTLTVTKIPTLPAGCVFLGLALLSDVNAEWKVEIPHEKRKDIRIGIAARTHHNLTPIGSDCSWGMKENGDVVGHGIREGNFRSAIKDGVVHFRWIGSVNSLLVLTTADNWVPILDSLQYQDMVLPAVYLGDSNCEYTVSFKIVSCSYDEALGPSVTSTIAASTHDFVSEQCIVCLRCGLCSGFFDNCVKHEVGRERGVPCGCGSGDSGCRHCKLCSRCAPLQPCTRQPQN